MRRFLISFLAALLFVPSLLAHPVPKTNRDRTIVVHVTARALIVDYRLELDEGSIPNELTAQELAHVTKRADLLETFTRSFAEATCRTLDASLDGAELRFQCVQHKYTASDHVRCEYRFESPWNLTPEVEHRLKFHETNYNTDDFSRLYLYLAADDSVRFVSAKAPSTELMNRSSDDRKPGDGNRLRRAEAHFRLAEDAPRAVSKPAFPPDGVIFKSEPDGRVSEGKASATSVETLTKATPEKVTPDQSGERSTVQPNPATTPVSPPTTVELPVPDVPPDASGESSIREPSSLWQRFADPNALQHLLLESREGMAVALLITALFGAAHALTPGHGKTLVAAYLVGERGTFAYAVILGVVTTLTHTAAVIVLAILYPLIFGNQKQLFTLQGLIGGALIGGLGLWMLLRRLGGQADHFHIGGGHHHHHHGHTHDHEHHEEIVPKTNGGKAGLWEVITLGMAGGMLPCLDAVGLLTWAISAGLAQRALPLLLAFSAGLATVLVVLGLVVVGTKQVAQAAAPSSKILSALTRAAPIVSAAALTLMGLWLCYGALNPPK